jgi:heat shock protein HslJ
MRRPVLIALLLSAYGATGAWGSPRPPVSARQPSLVGPVWTLSEYRPAGGGPPIRPAESEIYQLGFQEGGRLTARLSCNRGTGRWAAKNGRAATGSITIGPIAATMRGCLPGNLDRLAADLDRVRAYAIKAGRLHLTIAPDARATEGGTAGGGDYVWTPGG